MSVENIQLRKNSLHQQPEEKRTYSPFKFIKKLIFSLFIISIILYLALNFSTPIIKDKIKSYLNNSSTTEIRIDDIWINLLTKSIVIEDIYIKNPAQYGKENMLEIKQLSISPSLTSLMKGEFIVSKISIDRPVITLCTDGKQSNWESVFKKQKNKVPLIFPEELLIKNGVFKYSFVQSEQKTSTAEIAGIFIHTKNYQTPLEYIKDVPLYTKVKARGYFPTNPRGIININGRAYFTEKNISFLANLNLNNIQLAYFNDFYPDNSQVLVTQGSFDLFSKVECMKNQLFAKPNVTVKQLQLKLTKDYATSNIFELPISLVVEFFDIYREEIKFSFIIVGTLTDPKFQLAQVIKEQISIMINESIIRTIATTPNIAEKLQNLTEAIKGLGINLGKDTEKAIQQLEKPVEEFIKGIKGEE